MATKKTSFHDLLSLGLAIFSMFFGAGNVVMPLAIGIAAGTYTLFAVAGFTITAVASPLLGLASMVLFDGNIRTFFYRLGRVPGFALICLIVALIGPFAGIPRCIALSHTTFSMLVPGISIFWFSLAAALIVWLFSIRESKILTVLGTVLSPLLLLSLAIIVVRGFWNHPMALQPIGTPAHFFMSGLYEGYQTMDLLAALFFSSVVLVMLRKNLHPHDMRDERQLANLTFKAGVIGALLLGLSYAGLAFVASFWAPVIGNVSRDQTMGAIAYTMLGSYGGAIAAAAVVFATLTTAISLATVFSEFLMRDLFRHRMSYSASLFITLVISLIFANQGFDWIVVHIWPILKVCYPALVVLAVVNLLYKLYGFSWVKIPVFLTLLLTLASLYLETLLRI